MAADFGGKPWSWIHHVSVLTAAAANPGAEILFWYEHKPSGPWWDATRPHLTLCPIEAPRQIHGRPLVHPAHRADVLRLQLLEQYGGTYVDSDVWCLRPFPQPEACGFWMGRQGEKYGLCNATMGANANAMFPALWLSRYKTFRSQGRDQYWDEHSVRLPLALARENPDLLTIYPPDAFFAPLWGRLRHVFSAPRPGRPRQKFLGHSYSVHLWESICWGWLSRLGPRRIPARSEIGIYLHELGVL